jgi:hypothetical protein
MNPSPFFKQQSTFIPQQVPQNTQRGLYLNVFFIIGNVALIGMILVWAGLFGYRFYLEKSVNDLQDKLTASSEKALSDSNVQKIAEFRALEGRLTTGGKLLNSHLTLEPVFDFMEEMTLSKSVRYNSFKYELAEGNSFKITTFGSASSFSLLSYQESVLKENPKISDVKLTNFILDEKTGNVTFELNFNFMPEVLLFKNTVEGSPASPIAETPVETTATTSLNQTP